MTVCRCRGAVKALASWRRCTTPMLDETRWPATSALIDEACGLTGNGLMVGEGPKDDVRALWVGLYARGQRRASQLLLPEIRR